VEGLHGLTGQAGGGKEKNQKRDRNRMWNEGVTKMRSCHLTTLVGAFGGKRGEKRARKKQG